jgi:hypothetical protein
MDTIRLQKDFQTVSLEDSRLEEISLVELVLQGQRKSQKVQGFISPVPKPYLYPFAPINYDLASQLIRFEDPAAVQSEPKSQVKGFFKKLFG